MPPPPRRSEHSTQRKIATLACPLTRTPSRDSTPRPTRSRPGTGAPTTPCDPTTPLPRHDKYPPRISQRTFTFTSLTGILGGAFGIPTRHLRITRATELATECATRSRQILLSQIRGPITAQCPYVASHRSQASTRVRRRASASSSSRVSPRDASSRLVITEDLYPREAIRHLPPGKPCAARRRHRQGLTLRCRVSTERGSLVDGDGAGGVQVCSAASRTPHHRPPLSYPVPVPGTSTSTSYEAEPSAAASTGCTTSGRNSRRPLMDQFSMADSGLKARALAIRRHQSSSTS